MGLFDTLFDRLRGTPASADEPVLKEALELAVGIVEPRLKILPRYAERLRPALLHAIGHLRSVLGGLGTVHEASADGWSADPVVRAVFPRPTDVAAIVSRSREVQKYFRTNGAANELYGVLGMAFEEKHVLAPALQDGVIRQDVMRTQLSFGDHRIVMAGADLDAARRALGRAMFNQLLLNTAEQLASQDRQRKDLGVAKSLLQARLRMLQGHGTTLGAAFDESAPDPAVEIHEIEQQLARTTGAIGEMGGGVDALDKTLALLENTLLHAGDVLQLSGRKLRIDQFNTVLDAQAAETGAEIEFTVLRIASEPPRTRAGIFIRFDRAHLGRGGLAIDEVARSL